MKLLMAGILATAALFSVAPAVAHSDPSSDCTLRNTQMCGDHSRVFYCPDTGGFVSAFSGVCPGLVNGLTPPLPGGLPSGGDE